MRQRRGMRRTEARFYDGSDEELEEVTRFGGDVEKYRPEEDLRSVRRMVDPRLPPVKDVKDHELQGHLLYRNWCSVCVRAKGKDLDHRSDPLKERSVPEYSFDHKTAVLVGKERIKTCLGGGDSCEGL